MNKYMFLHNDNNVFLSIASKYLYSHQAVAARYQPLNK